jgi:hypothetical protein
VDKLMIKQNPHIRFEVWLDFDPHSKDEVVTTLKGKVDLLLLKLQVEYKSTSPQVKTANR